MKEEKSGRNREEDETAREVLKDSEIVKQNRR